RPPPGPDLGGSGRRGVDAPACPAPATRRLDLAAVLADDQVADRQPQPRALARAAPGVERLEDVLQHLRRHAAAGIDEAQLRAAVALAQADRQRAVLVHALQGVDDQVEDDGLDLLAVDPGGDPAAGALRRH